MSVTPLRSPSTISGLTGWFTGFSAEMNASNELTRWRDLSGKGNHVESSAIRSGSINTSTSATNQNPYNSTSTADAKLGVTPFPFLYGSTGAGLQFPTAVMSTTSNYTLFHVARYYKPGDAVPTRKRIFDGVTTNWLSGFYGGKSGVAYHHNNWLTQPQTNLHGDTWVLSTDQKDMYRSNGTNRTVSGYSGGSSRQLSINDGSTTGQRSDWACAEVIVYDRELTSAEYEAVEAYLNAKYFSTNLEIPSTGPISLMSFATYLHDGTGYPISLQSLASNFGLTSSIGFSNFRGGAQIPRVSPVVVTTSDLPTQVFTIRGPSFTSTPSIKFVGANGTEYNVSSTTYVSQGVATFTLGTLTSAQLANQPFKIKIGSDTSIDTISSFISLPTRSVNESLTYDLGSSPYTNSSTLPSGLSISGGILSGTLTTAGTYDFTLTGTLSDPNGNWTEQADIQASNRGTGDLFGFSVAISSDGNTAIVGAPFEDTAYDNAGSAYIFTLSSGTWTHQEQIQASNRGRYDRFGTSVAISSDGNTVIVAATHTEVGNITDAGSVYIFTRSNGIWTEHADILGGGAVGNSDLFGTSIAISSDGNTIIVGTPYDRGPTDTLTWSGTAYIFTLSNGNWTQQRQIRASNAGHQDRFGTSVAISGNGNTVLVGAPREDSQYTDTGATYIFTRSNGTWTEHTDILRGSDRGINDQFGTSVAISSDGNTAIVGATTAGTDTGSAYIFTRDSNGDWDEQDIIQASNGGTGDNFGTSVAISSDGNTAIVGAPFYEETGGTNTGSAYIFTRDSNGTWTERSDIQGNEGDNDNFGTSIAISPDGNTVIVAAPYEDRGGTSTGSVYVFTIPPPSQDYRMVVTN